MARQTKEVKITHQDGSSHTYMLTQCDGVTGRKAVARLLRLVGPAVEKGAEKRDKGPEEMLLAALAGVASNPQLEADMDYFCDLMAKQTLVNGMPLEPIFGEHFAGRYVEMLQW